MGIIGFLLFIIFIIIIIFNVCLKKVTLNNIKELNNTIEYDIQIGDLFVSREILIEPDNPFKTNDITDECNYNKIHIVKDIKYNHKNKLWVKYTSLISLKCGFEITYELPASDFLIVYEKRNDLKKIFNL